MNLTTKAAGVGFAVAALCGIGLSAASAASAAARTTVTAASPAARLPVATVPAPIQSGDDAFVVDLINNTTSPLKIYTYLGSDWDMIDGTPPIGTIIGKGDEIPVYLYFDGGASDAIGISPTAYSGNLGLGIFQDHAGGQSEAVLADSTLNINVSFDGEGTAQISIVN